MCFIILIEIIRHLADIMHSFYLFMVGELCNIKITNDNDEMGGYIRKYKCCGL